MSSPKNSDKFFFAATKSTGAAMFVVEVSIDYLHDIRVTTRIIQDEKDKFCRKGACRRKSM